VPVGVASHLAQIVVENNNIDTVPVGFVASNLLYYDSDDADDSNHNNDDDNDYSYNNDEDNDSDSYIGREAAGEEVVVIDISDKGRNFDSFEL
jgi:hypothetical protein